MRAVIYIRIVEKMDRQHRREWGTQWLYEAVAASGYPEITAKTCPVCRTEKGKPYFMDRPEVHFSISHSRDRWACVVADGPVGLDLQYHKAGRLANIPGRFFHPKEAGWLEKLGFCDEEPVAAGTELAVETKWTERIEAMGPCVRARQPHARQAFFDVWAAKESYVKWTGEGIDRHFHEFAVADENGLLERCGGAYFWRQDVLTDYSLCLCGGEPWDEVRIVTMDDRDVRRGNDENRFVSDAGDGR